MSTLVQAVSDIYAQHPVRGRLRHAPIAPFIGRAYREPDDHDLRILLLGVNAYVDDREWSAGLPSPGKFADWFVHQTYRFHKNVAHDVAALAEPLLRQATYLHGLVLRGTDSIYLTNFVKSYVATSEGKREDQLTPEDLDAYQGAWEAEIDALAAHDVLPHIVVVYSRRIWDHAWRPFYQPRPGRQLVVHDYRAAETPAHYANRLRVSGASEREQPLLLVRLRHPSARDRTADARWLLAQSGVQTLLELQR